MSREAQPTTNQNALRTRRQFLAGAAGAGATAALVMFGRKMNASADGGVPCDPISDNGCTPTESTVPYTKPETTIPETTTTAPETTTTIPETTTTAPETTTTVPETTTTAPETTTTAPYTPTTTPYEQQQPPVHVG